MWRFGVSCYDDFDTGWRPLISGSWWDPWLLDKQGGIKGCNFIGLGIVNPHICLLAPHWLLHAHTAPSVCGFIIFVSHWNSRKAPWGFWPTPPPALVLALCVILAEMNTLVPYLTAAFSDTSPNPLPQWNETAVAQGLLACLRIPLNFTSLFYPVKDRSVHPSHHHNNTQHPHPPYHRILDGTRSCTCTCTLTFTHTHSAESSCIRMWFS